MSFLLRINSRESGALFNARARVRLMHDFTDELEEEGADWALSHIKATYHREFKNPTGFYESNVRVRNTAAGPEVWDGGNAGPVYGPWLEGVGSRNFPATRFRGYHAFRLAAAALEQRIDEMGDRLFDGRYGPRF